MFVSFMIMCEHELSFKMIPTSYNLADTYPQLSGEKIYSYTLWAYF